MNAGGRNLKKSQTNLVGSAEKIKIVGVAEVEHGKLRLERHTVPLVVSCFLAALRARERAGDVRAVSALPCAHLKRRPRVPDRFMYGRGVRCLLLSIDCSRRFSYHRRHFTLSASIVHGYVAQTLFTPQGKYAHLGVTAQTYQTCGRGATQLLSNQTVSTIRIFRSLWLSVVGETPTNQAILVQEH